MAIAFAEAGVEPKEYRVDLANKVRAPTRENIVRCITDVNPYHSLAGIMK